jgi:hypothetical protein
MEGRSASHKGILQVAVEVFEMAPDLHMVEVRKAGGDTLEYHKVGGHADWLESPWGPLLDVHCWGRIGDVRCIWYAPYLRNGC